MTSPVDTSVKHFFSSMAGAPVLTKSAGSLIALLDALLVLGFDSKAATSLTVNNGIATLAFAGTHSAKALAVILIAGAEAPYAALNGEQKVLSASAGSITFAAPLANGSATGAVTFKMAPAGWQKVYTATNVGVYKSLDPLSFGRYLRVDDTGRAPGPGYARVKGYTTMTAISTGTGQFPLAAQLQEDTANGGWWPKGYQADANTNPIAWSFFADSRIFYYAPQTYTAEGYDPARYYASHMIGFGDLIPYRTAGDVYATALSAGLTSSGAQSYPESGAFNHNYQSTYGASFMPRKADTTGTSQSGRTTAYGARNLDSLSGQANGELGPFPSPIDGSLIYAPRYWIPQISTENDWTPRAEVPGVLHILQSNVLTAFGRDAVIDGDGRWQGRKLYGFTAGSPTGDVLGSPSSYGLNLVDLTGPWR